MTLLDEIRAKRSEILAIARECGLKDVKVFGSVARGEETPESDIDFLVTADPQNAKGWETFGFAQEVSKLLGGRPVDMAFEHSLFHLLRQKVQKEARPL